MCYCNNSNKVLSFVTCKKGHYLCENCLSLKFNEFLENKMPLKCMYCEDETNFDEMKFKYTFTNGKKYHNTYLKFLNNDDNMSDYLFFKFINQESVDTGVYKGTGMYNVGAKKFKQTLYTIYDQQEEFIQEEFLQEDTFEDSFEKLYCNHNNCESFGFFDGYCITHYKTQLQTTKTIHDKILNKTLNKKIDKKVKFGKCSENYIENYMIKNNECNILQTLI